MLFPQFYIFREKKHLNYVDLKNLLLVTINIRESWNFDALKNATGRTWDLFRNKLTDDQKIIFRTIIVELRREFRRQLDEENLYWLSTSKVNTLFSSLTPSLIEYRKRQVILSHHKASNGDLFNTVEPSAL